jgi:phosphate acyltransferase
MGNDSFPIDLFYGIEQAAKQLSDVELIFFLDQSVFDFINSNFSSHPSIKFVICQNFIRMDDDPLIALRTKKQSSLVLGVQDLKNGNIDAFISAGNTGAIIASATLLLPRLPTIKRTALLATMPSEKGEVAIIDVGGNISYKASHLLQFAEMGSAFYHSYYNHKKPTVALLNIGTESKKGTSEIKLAYELLSAPTNQKNFDFIGNIEGKDVFKGVANVIVTNGFAGNILLKTAEGASAFMLKLVGQVLNNQISSFSKEIMQQLIEKSDYENYNGAIVCGLDRILIKCHGKSSSRGLMNGINLAIQLIKTNFIEKIKSELDLK